MYLEKKNLEQNTLRKNTCIYLEKIYTEKKEMEVFLKWLNYFSI